MLILHLIVRTKMCSTSTTSKLLIQCIEGVLIKLIVFKCFPIVEIHLLLFIHWSLSLMTIMMYDRIDGIVRNSTLFCVGDSSRKSVSLK